MLKKMLSNEELLILLRRKVNFGRDQKAAAVDWQIGFGHIPLLL